MNIKKKLNTFLNAPTNIFASDVSKNTSIHTQDSMQDFNEKLQSIHDRINKLHKQLTYWDLYHITQTVSSADEFGLKFSALNIGESMIINANKSFMRDQRLYSRGDIVMKMENGEKLYIAGRNAGVYKPSNIALKDNNNLAITYEFLDYQPTTTEEKNLNYAVTLTGIQAKAAYSINQILPEPSKESNESTCQFDVIKANEKTVQPVIKFFLDNEEVYIDYKLTLSNNQYTVTVSKPPKGLTIIVK